MSLKEKVEAAMKEAMRAGDKKALVALRAIKSLIQLAETEKPGYYGLSAETEIQILNKAVKQRKDSANIYMNNGREELAQNELEEAKVIEQFLPQQLAEEEVDKIVGEIVEKTGASGMKDMGRVMNEARAEIAGRADGKRIADAVKKALAG
ncbi:GatB/YqeY domain-containing protein [Flammeovirgaceae bacterium SG7u.111]|nr:GatB/YqeY domain-containing protein [Flammeovirgaceae bacterium SG7u.132]WPO35338.1 GatB/YqeY domain-containing protein [Flammeovirgaceae bacterium SG7u.111]